VKTPSTNSWLPSTRPSLKYLTRNLAISAQAHWTPLLVLDLCFVCLQAENWLMPQHPAHHSDLKPVVFTEMTR
jgi:hypothetical protein